MTGPEAAADLLPALLAGGRWREAEALLREALARDPGDSRSLRRLGTVCHVTGRSDEARELLSRALDRDPDNTATLLNLGSVELACGQPGAARRCFARVVTLQPDSADGHFNLGISAQRDGDLDTAHSAWMRALECDPSLLDAAANLAALELQRGDPAASLTHSARVLEHRPGHPQAFVLHARALIGLSRSDEAERLLAGAPGELSEHPQVDALRGRLHFLAGRLGEAVSAYQQALGKGDSSLETAMDLGRCLLDSGKVTAAVEVLRRTTAEHDEVPACHALLGLACLDAGRHDEAVSAYDRAIALEPGTADHHAMRAQALYALERAQEAEAAVDTAIALAPAVVSPHLLRVEQCVARGDLPGALAACENYLSGQGLECSLLAARGFLLHALGRSAEAVALLDYPRLLHSWMVDVPGEFPDLATFNAALARHIRAHPSLSADNAASRATQIGRQSSNLLQGERGPFVAFEALLWRAAQRYLDTVGRDPLHPFLARPPPLGAAHSWAVVLERCGYQSPHIHPTAWLSGVYYPELPARVREGDDEQGWIEFGAPPPEFVLTPAAPTHRVRPQEGLIVLFPSYFYHRTVPCESDEQRISIAFDFSPRRG